MGILNDIVIRTTSLSTPGHGTTGALLGLVNCLLFGVGVIIAGVMEDRVTDIVIGILQLVIPFVGWVWAFIWGILMIVRNL